MKVLVSRGYGAGWSTWNDPRMAIDEELIRLFEEGCSYAEMEEACVRRGYTDDGEPPYMGGFSNLEIEEIPCGTWFKVMEYDGAEYIEKFDDTWIYAKD